MNKFYSHQKWAALITAYLAQHPQAGDTLEGIARWWLNADQADFPQIQLALNELERQRAMARYIAADGREHYSKYPPLQVPRASP